ncbi:RDD family protein [Bacillus taeanensis]|uniref:RDD family protein n=1 Tax=Bacillus taeanensis TaxID=273032 RepID=A0A366XPW2_9BACI|nr:RDD family protein [Bacillus taeanensis]RBW68152.1 RDD family protein [Bacillus taeanensis]
MVKHPAGFWIRVGAALLDGLIVSLPLGIIASFIGDGGQDPTSSSQLFVNLIIFLYGLLVPLYWSGYTVGKRIVGIRILRIDGENVRITNMLIRTVVTGLLYAFTFGIAVIVSAIMVGARKDKRSLHDLIAGTYVTYQKP